ncbi:aldehyde dehydrogenase family protein [Rubrivirga sp.]|uniref:aldehyde dehydrogenase family protein n=1 Tax=Rubrivirga sp. TaxID=1885344 RepID=UPI003C78581A
MTTPPRPADSTPAEIDAALADLEAVATEWARLPIPLKISLLEGLPTRIEDAAGRWVTAASRAKGLPEGSPLRGEEWSSGPWAVASYIEPLKRTLQAAESGSLASLVEGKTRQRPDGQTIVRVLPDGLYDHLLFSGIEVDVWQEPGVTPATLPDTMATFYREDAPDGAVAVVLGAGNIASIPALDVLYKLYAEGQVVLLKMNPVNAYLQPIFEEVFADFVQAGYLRFASGGAEVGKLLTGHDLVDEIHVTGSARTHDAIVYGTGAEGEQRKERDEPISHKRVTSELGGVSPCLVVPGDWSEPDLEFQAENVASQKMHNGGFNCIASQVLILPEGWTQRDPFVHAVRRALRELPDRPSYYPGTDDRVQDLQNAYPDTAERLGATGARTLVENVPAEPGEPAFTEEVFGPALAVTSLPGGTAGDDAADWLDRAVDFCNEHVVGTLGATVVIHPRTIKALGDRFWDAIARLRYGTVGINVWSGVNFFIAGGTWGAFPGHTRDDIQSGTGVVHNAYLFERPQKTVIQGPFAPFPRSLLLGETHVAPKPIWFVTNATAETSARRLLSLATSPTPLKLPGIFASALRG